ncbi:hypothetical protein [Paenibacillus radicis (ex Gao et al. 2016)]|uniref:Uncharacterized protein n=1 Tax=Paenibacillus radicis (ex Gao et al. 2016) TaxID=1737354 RepID=A0A917GYD1_9BACL|nr:hypothetical protein [Paenibacillus radicis (ex Gao et al. 2016)]GGG61555.1 hypothetical protein GCM10010918_13850 [Paenibacillus radicis (ex Gao et al. 2016)]
MRKYGLSLLLLVIAASWGGNLWYYKMQKLEQPIFLQHYYEMPASLFQNTSLYYVMNKDDLREPVYFELPTGQLLQVAHIQSRDERGRLQLKEAIVSPAFIDDLKQMKEPLTIDQVKVHYSTGGETETVSIGKIIVYPDRREEQALEQQSVHASSGGTGSASYTTTRDLTIASVDYSFPEMLQGIMKVKVNGIDAADAASFPIQLKKRAGFHVSYNSYSLPKNDERRFQAFIVRINYWDEKGDSVGDQSFYIQPQLYAGDLRSYVKSREGDDNRE